MNESKIYVGNLPYKISEQELEDFFAQYGEISDLKIIYDRPTGRSKGFGFITFVDADSAKKAVDEANEHEIDGRPLRVNVAHEEKKSS